MTSESDGKDSMERIEGILLAVSHGMLTERQGIAQIWDVFHTWNESSDQKDADAGPS